MEKKFEQKFGGRKWVKLWVNEWLDGTTRYQMTDGQRAFWIDLLALAGRSRFPGVVCSGRDGEQWIGYPLQKFQGMLSDPIDVAATFELFTRTEKISIAISPDGKLYTLFISNWQKYQSEYERLKKYRDATQNVHEKYAKGNTVEVRSKKVEERRKETSKPTPRFACPDWIRTDVWDSFEEMRKKIRAPMTDRARTGIVRELEKLRSSCDPNESLLQSVTHSWRGVFELRGSNGTLTSKHAEAQRRTLEAARRTMERHSVAGSGGMRAALPVGTDRS